MLITELLLAETPLLPMVHMGGLQLVLMLRPTVTIRELLDITPLLKVKIPVRSEPMPWQMDPMPMPMVPILRPVAPMLMHQVLTVLSQVEMFKHLVPMPMRSVRMPRRWGYLLTQLAPT